ncbi:hypothetical protein GYMLUDRAFT_233586 [Collybiopsis luxurians FD-317 M1]|uniref:Methyltransferase domain-containing protein n=1 Tax=Collybiopsis luxurians FD-317 M1 TaxID=944289 RepID=A0A0D0C2T1_9AGAR|nr:hypothetical protein GYMLUDRAFT_233586 [Collybiopsis luxurians FD-317 M1]
MAEHAQQRYYASKQYLLPADGTETARLNLQHRIILQTFENQLSLAPLNLENGDRILESAAGTGIWALEFLEENKKKGIMLEMDCIDISDKQFTPNYPSNLNFSLHSVTDLPAEWSSTFLYAHQRLLIAAMNDTLWRKAISEFFRVLVPGGWVELVEIEAKDGHWDVGPSSTKVQSILSRLYGSKGVVGDLGTYLPTLLKEAGFVDVRCEERRTPVGPSGFPGDEWGKFWKGLKRDVADGGGYGFVNSGEEYEQLVDEAVSEWNTKPGEAFNTYYTILGRKP